MKIVPAANLACPLDGGPLERSDRQLRCPQGHCFDIARQGYINLLPVQHKRSRAPGDSKAMVAARSAFLGKGLYTPIAERLAAIALAQTDGRRESCLLDAGCGEGYYLAAVTRALAAKAGEATFAAIGLDISKPAIVEAARRSREITWLVGTNRQPPLLPASVDVVLCVFGFQSFEGFAGVLRDGGRVILVEPGPDHLQELRAVIYPDVRKTEPPDLSRAQALGFSQVDRQRLQFNTGPVDQEGISQLLLMTPHFFRASREGRDAALELQALSLTVDVVFRVLAKNADDSSK